MLFWIVGGLIALFTLLPMLMPLLRRPEDVVSDARSDLLVYKDQLKEIDSDIARGVLSTEDAETSRIEISRRLLAADARKDDWGEGTSPGTGRLVAMVAILGAVTAAFMLYIYIGQPGLKDLPLAERLMRPSQEVAEARFVESGRAILPVLDSQQTDLIDRLRTTLKERPDDLRGHRLLVQTLTSIEDFAGARRGQADVLRILGDTATSNDFAQMAELMIFAAGGIVSKEAEDALVKALKNNPTDNRARFYSGISLAQNGQSELAQQLWIGLLNEADDDVPWRAAVEAQLRQLSQTTGLPMPEGLGLPGPTREDIEAAQDMSAEDRMTMIRSMVEGLSDRLATEGGTAEEWARLVRALGVLGETDRAQAIFNEAKGVFAERPDALQTVSDAAAAAGLQ